jgi:hypothetical protein
VRDSFYPENWEEQRDPRAGKKWSVEANDGKRVCIGDTYVTSVDRSSGRVQHKAHSGGSNIATCPIQLDGPKRSVDPQKGPLPGRS